MKVRLSSRGWKKKRQTHEHVAQEPAVASSTPEPVADVPTAAPPTQQVDPPRERKPKTKGGVFLPTPKSSGDNGGGVFLPTKE